MSFIFSLAVLDYMHMTDERRKVLQELMHVASKIDSYILGRDKQRDILKWKSLVAQKDWLVAELKYKDVELEKAELKIQAHIHTLNTYISE